MSNTFLGAFIYLTIFYDECCTRVRKTTFLYYDDYVDLSYAVFYIVLGVTKSYFYNPFTKMYFEQPTIYSYFFSNKISVGIL